MSTESRTRLAAEERLFRAVDRILLPIALARVGASLLASGEHTLGCEPLTALLPLFLAALGVWLWVGHRGDPRSQVFGGFWIVGAAAMSTPALTDAQLVGVSWVDAVRAVDPQLLVAWYLWRFFAIFPRAHDPEWARPFLRWGPLVVLIVALTTDVLHSVRLAQGVVEPLAGLEQIASGDPGCELQTLKSPSRPGLWLGLLCGPALLLGWARSQRATHQERQRVRVFLFAILTLLVVVLGLSALDWETPSSDEGRATSLLAERIVQTIGQTALLLMAIVTTVLVPTQRVLDVERRVGRLLGLRVAQSAIWALSLLPILGMALVPVRGTDGGMDVKILLTSLALAVALLAWMRERSLRALRLAYFGDDQQAVRELFSFGRALRNDPAGWQARLDRFCGAAFGADGTVALLEPGAEPAERLPQGSRLAEVLSLRRRPLTRERAESYDWERELTESDRAWLRSHRVAVLAPVRSSGDDLLGVLALSRKRNETHYDVADLEAVDEAAALLGAHFGSAASGEADGAPVEASSICMGCDRVLAANEVHCQECDLPTSPSEIPRKIGRDLLLRRSLGQGAFGHVYEALDTPLRRHVAVKVLPERAANGDLSHEAAAMAQLAHPHLAAVHRITQDEGRRFLVTELMRGGTLRQRLAEGPIPWQEVLQLMGRLGSALRVIHTKGLQHGDIRPENIGFTENGLPKLIDLGLTGFMSELENGAPGDRPRVSPLYASPERWRGEPASDTDDLWSLFVSAHEAVTGSYPFAHATFEDLEAAICAGAPESLEGVNGCPRLFAELVARGLKPQPASRYVDAEELLQRLDPVAKRLGIPAF